MKTTQIDIKDISQYLTQRYIENFLNCHFPEATPITNHLNKYLNLPKLGSHLISPRTGYTHHGIYVGKESVVHYSGLANGLKSGPVEMVSLNEFIKGKTFEVKPHQDASFSNEDIIRRAKSRLGETEYNLIFNNCEHFVNWCIYNVNTSQQAGSVVKVAAHTTLKTLERSNPYTATAAAITHSSKHIVAYIKGDISWEKFSEEISHTAVVTTSTVYYATLGQYAIPIPVLGAFVGASIGYFVGNMLFKSGLIAIGDSQIVKEAKQRRQIVEKFCQTLIPQIQKSRKELEDYIDKYFLERKKEFCQAFDIIDNSLNKWDPDTFAMGLEKINNQFGASLQFKTFDEFDKFMESNETFKF